MERRKKKTRMVTVDETGMIAVDGFEIERQQWSLLIPSILSKCKSLLTALLVGDDWQSILDLRNQVAVASGFTFTRILSCGRRLGVDLKLRQGYDASLFDQLCSYMELCFHGLGLGSMRYEEIQSLDGSRCLWHRSTVYFDVYGKKVYSHKTKAATSSDNAIEHKLPPSVGRLYLVYKQIATQVENLGSSTAIPRRSASKHTMCCAMAEIFGFAEIPDAVQVRHFWTSILNFLFPDGNLGDALFAEEDVAERSGHSSSTHRVKYSSQLAGGMEFLYRRLHSALGEKGSSDAAAALCQSTLLAALRIFFGPDAEYTSSGQQQLVEFSSSQNSGHGHADLSCGSGKSMAWTLPVASRVLFGRHSSSALCTVVVLPYKFLSLFHTEAACSFLENHTDAWIVTLNASDFGHTSPPDALSVDGILPDILFISIDALAACIERHCARLARLCREGRIHRFIIDEVHTMLVEEFRPAYQCLARLPSFGVPILTMSGSLPQQFRASLLEYVGLSASRDSMSDVTLIRGGDILGNFPSDFSFSCNVVRSPRDMALQSVRCLLRDGNGSIHVMVAAKRDAASLFSDMEALSISCRLLTADISVEEQQEIAAEWRAGKIRVLASTTIAIVGNENKLCRHLVLCGYPYNLINTVQAINRLRPSQRIGGASIRIFIHNFPRQTLDVFWEKDRVRFDSLAERKLIPDDADLWKLFGSVEGVHEWLVTEEGCRIANLARKFGIARGDCGICDRCKGTPVQRAAAANSMEIQKRNSTANDAMNVLRRLDMQCLVCQSEFCDGEQCLPPYACFRCGGPHQLNMCTVDWKTVMRNRGCYFCLDIKSRQGFVSHKAKDNECPLQRRLKRLVIESFASSGEPNIARFYSRISSERSTFYSFLSEAARKPTRHAVTRLSASQVSDDNDSAPLLPPDHYCSRELGEEQVDFTKASESRDIYKFLQKQPDSKRRQREFVYGALYKNLIGSDFAVIDCSGDSVRHVEISVETEGGGKTTISITNESGSEELLESIVALGASVGKSGNCRKDVGDKGEMWGLGYRNKKSRDKYVVSENKSVQSAMLRVCRNVVTELESKFPETFKSIRDAEASGPKCPPLPEMGGKCAPGSCIMFSKNLGNSSHYDFKDKSMSLSIWVEERVGSASNWYFILPNVRLNGRLGIAIRLFHGCVITWDGRIIKHCTSVTNTGKDNSVYGCMFGSCRD
jgi:superfamily II DNA helicase RecQ